MSARFARLLPLLALPLLAACPGTPEAIPMEQVPEQLRGELFRTDKDFELAKAVAKSPPPSLTSELDDMHDSANKITPELKIANALVPIDQPLPPPTLRAGDQVAVTVFGHEDLTGPAVVGPDGRIQVGKQGLLQVECLGLTTEQLSIKVRDAIQRDILKEGGKATVAVQLTLASQRSVKVIGRVRSHTLRNQAGLATSVVALPPERPISVFGLLTLVQGLEDDADGDRLTLSRKATGGDKQPKQGRERLCYHFSFKELADAHLKGLELWLEADDELIVGRLPDVYAYGAVAQPGRSPLRRGTTVAGVLLRNGGVGPDSDERGVLLLSGEEIDAVPLTTELEAGQVVFVPPRKRIYVAGRGVTRNGPITLPPTGMTALQAITEAGWFTLDGDEDGVEIWRTDPQTGKLIRIAVPVDEIREGTQQDAAYALRPGDIVFVPEGLW